MSVLPARERLRGWQQDPVEFCREVLGFEPYSKQIEIAESVRDHDRVAVRACNASGKTAVAAALVPWWLAGGPGSLAITTAPTARQVVKLLWREIAQRMRHADGFFDGATVTGTEILLAPNWYATGVSTDETEAFQGFHGRRVLVIVDEASGVDEKIFEAVEGVLASGDSKLLLIGNPTRTSGTFFQAFHNDADLWHQVHISAFDTPAWTGESVNQKAERGLVSRRWVERAELRWGEKSPLWQVRVLGQFPSQADDSVIAAADVDAARARTLEPSLPLVVAADVARYGSDDTVIALRAGDVVRIASVYSGKDTMHTVGAILQIARDLRNNWDGRKPLIVIDDAGLGGGVVDRLREQNEFEVKAFLGARRARQERDFPNRRSESWFQFAEALDSIDLDDDADLAADLLAPRYALDSQGRRVMERKDVTKQRLRRSPDRGDAVTMAFAIDRPRRSTFMRVLAPTGRIADHPPVLTLSDVIAAARDRMGRRDTGPTFPLPCGVTIAHAASGVRPGDVDPYGYRVRPDLSAVLRIENYDPTSGRL